MTWGPTLVKERQTGIEAPKPPISVALAVAISRFLRWSPVSLRMVDVGEMFGFEADGQERILEMSLVQKDGFIKAQDRTHGQKELYRGREEWLIICFQVGRG